MIFGFQVVDLVIPSSNCETVSGLCQTKPFLHASESILRHGKMSLIVWVVEKIGDLPWERLVYMCCSCSFLPGPMQSVVALRRVVRDKVCPIWVSDSKC